MSGLLVCSIGPLGASGIMDQDPFQYNGPGRYIAMLLNKDSANLCSGCIKVSMCIVTRLGYFYFYVEPKHLASQKTPSITHYQVGHIRALNSSSRSSTTTLFHVSSRPFSFSR